jgi:signal transduction histidine kinase/ActR/RegA family two-component response regulator
VSDSSSPERVPVDGPREWSEQLRGRFLGIGMVAVGLACLVFAIARYFTTLSTGLVTPWLYNALGMVTMLILYVWFRRAPRRRSRVAVHATAVVATLVLLVPVAYEMPSTVWWLSLVGFAMALMSRRLEAYAWTSAIVLLILAVPLIENWWRVENAAGERTLEMLMARVVFALILFGIAFAFRREIEKRASQLLRLTGDLKAANSAKDRFIAHMSHELRTPLHGLLGSTEQLLAEVEDEHQRARLTAVRKSGHRLLLLVNDLIDVSSGGARSAAERPRRFNICEATESVLGTFAALAEKKAIDLQFNASPQLNPWRKGLEQRLRQIVFHLVSNAVKFTPSGTVAVSLAPEPDLVDRLHLRVSDTGPGITDAVLAQIGRAFVVESTAANRDHQGAGLGLALVTQWVRQLGGEIRFSRQLPHGTVVDVVLHLPRAEDEPADPAITEMAVGDSAIVGDDNGAVDAPLRILICEDDPVGRDLIEATLASLGHFCVVVNDGAAGLDQATREHFDLVITDIEMPQVDGYMLLDRLRELERTRGSKPVPVIAITAHASADDRDRFLQRGFDEYLAKPFKLRELGELLAIVGSSRSHTSD